MRIETKEGSLRLSFGETIWLWLKFFGWIVFLLVVVRFFYSSAPAKFNPETDVCEQWESCKVYINPDNLKEEERICGPWEIGEYNLYYEYYEMIEDPELGYVEKKCLKYHPKTFCELCLDDWTGECEERCQCDEYEQIRHVNHDVLKKSCIPINSLSNEPVEVNVKFEPNEGLIDGDEIKRQIGQQMKGRDIWDVFSTNITVNVQGSSCDPVMNIIENDTGSFMCFEYGGEWESLQIEDHVIDTGNITDLFNYVNGTCTKAHEKSACELVRSTLQIYIMLNQSLEVSS